jgi:hypothetical protein
MRLMGQRTTMARALDLMSDHRGTIGMAAAGAALAGGVVAASKLVRRRRSTGVADSAEAGAHVPSARDIMNGADGGDAPAWEDVGGEPAGVINFDARPELAEWRAGEKGKFR